MCLVSGLSIFFIVVCNDHCSQRGLWFYLFALFKELSSSENKSGWTTISNLIKIFNGCVSHFLHERLLKRCGQHYPCHHIYFSFIFRRLNQPEIVLIFWVLSFWNQWHVLNCPEWADYLWAIQLRMRHIREKTHRRKIAFFTHLGEQRMWIDTMLDCLLPGSS